MAAYARFQVNTTAQMAAASAVGERYNTTLLTPGLGRLAQLERQRWGWRERHHADATAVPPQTASQTCDNTNATAR